MIKLITNFQHFKVCVYVRFKKVTYRTSKSNENFTKPPSRNHQQRMSGYLPPFPMVLPVARKANWRESEVSALV